MSRRSLVDQWPTRETSARSSRDARGSVTVAQLLSSSIACWRSRGRVERTVFRRLAARTLERCA